MQITDIKKTKQGRYALFCDDEFLFSIDAETMAKKHIEIDMQISDSEIYNLRCVSDERKAKDKALQYLSLRDYSSTELYDKLCLKFDQKTSACAVAAMQELGLLDDEAFARHRAQYLAKKNKSVREIAIVLKQKGIERDTIENVLSELDADDEHACLQLINKSYMSRLEKGEKDKVIAALARRGFGYGIIKSAVETVLQDMRENTEYDI